MQCSLSCRTWQLTYRQLEVRVAESARYTYRLRMSASAKSALLAEWDRCRWVWNECVVQSRDAHCARRECGPAMLDVMLTGWRAKYEWLRAGASVPQQQTIRDFGRSRTKALKDIRSRLPVPKRAGMPRFKQKYRAAPTLNYTRRGFRLDGANPCLAKEIIVRPVWSQSPVECANLSRQSRTLVCVVRGGLHAAGIAAHWRSDWCRLGCYQRGYYYYYYYYYQRRP
jgi:hypothetical protein